MSYLGDHLGTGSMDLLVRLSSQVSFQRVPQCVMSFGSGARGASGCMSSSDWLLVFIRVDTTRVMLEGL